MCSWKKSQNVALGIGSNLGEPTRNIDQAIQLLKAGGVSEVVCSKLITTSPVGCVSNTPDFTNGAIVGCWENSPEELLDLCQQIERTIGRPEIHRQDEARLIDLDILLFEERVIESQRLTVPHPRMHERFFVLAPLAEVAGKWYIAKHGFVTEVLSKI